MSPHGFFYEFPKSPSLIQILKSSNYLHSNNELLDYLKEILQNDLYHFICEITAIWCITWQPANMFFSGAFICETLHNENKSLLVTAMYT